LHLTDTQRDIKDFTLNNSGIYMFLCLVNNKSYIGSALNNSNKTNRLYTRFCNHIRHKELSNTLLQKSISKYGLNNFEYYILEFCDPKIVRER
jgi:group I intron endonuclease